MKTDYADLLIIGGPATIPQTKTGFVIKTIPFNLSGLAKAYKLMPDSKSIMIVPDLQGFSKLPEVSDFDHILGHKHASMLLSELDLISTGSSDGMRDQVARNLPKLSKKRHRASFIRNTVYTFLDLIKERASIVVNGGGTVFLLFGEDYPSWPPEYRAVICTMMSGNQVNCEETWAAHVTGEYAWLLKNVKSALWFGTANYDREVTEAKECSSDPGRTFIPNRIPRLAFGVTPTTREAGAVDRSGLSRVLVFGWGKGKFILAPAVCFSALLEHLVSPVVPSDMATKSKQAVEPPVAVPAGKKKPRRPNLNIASTYKKKAYGIWMSYRNDINGEPTYRDCYTRNEDTLKGLKILSEADLKRVCESEIKRLKSKK